VGGDREKKKGKDPYSYSRLLQGYQALQKKLLSHLQGRSVEIWDTVFYQNGGIISRDT